MSINVYLRGNEVEELQDFTAEERLTKQGGERYDYNLPGVKVFRDKGRWFVTLNEPTDPIPAVVADIVEEISLKEMIPVTPKREAGIYCHESAEAEIEVPTPNLLSTELRIRAEKMKDLLELYRMIKMGSLRPKQSYEGKQEGVSRTELEAAFKRLEQMNIAAFKRLKQTDVELDALRQKLNGRWPFCSKKKVRNVIPLILAEY